ncbi:WD40 repeat domain-containing protein [Paenibacillus xylanexedens]|uniref:Uncharacterized protein n=1 Tax=Paenibacillus xylanexedens TaxID=528191 RepID=A0ABS4RLM1_PAEXY|nr:beta-propeller fold lactonase family protein [Paenibacillus xylanexedens]MBP2243796.1 hypothetical protein [Paenibacillus xylanexedens]
MSRFPWRNTSEDITAEAQSQWETPAGAQEKANAAEQAAKDYSDVNLNAHIGTGGAAHAIVVAGGAAGFMTGADKTKLDGVAPGANNYIHPATHPPSIIAQDSGNRFVTDAEKADWNSKATGALATPSTDGLMAAADKGKLDGVQAGAEANQNAFAGVNNVLATNKTDTLQFTGGTGITITTNPANKQVTVTATGSATPGAHASSHITGGTDVIPNAVTNGNAGLMSGADAQFVRIEGETKAGAQNKADAALISANEYTDGVTAEVSAEVNQALANATANYIRQPGYAATSGTSSAYVVTLDPVPTTLPDGFGITIVPHITNAAGPTLNINGLGATPLKKQDGTAYAAGDLLIGKPYTFRKVGTDFLADSGGGEVDINGQLQQSVVYAEAIAANDPIYLQSAVGDAVDIVPDKPTSAPRAVAYSTDGVYMVAVQNSSPYINIYKLSGGVYTKLTNPTTLPTGDSYGVSFSVDGTYLAVAHSTSPYVTIYKRSGDTFTKLANPSSLPTGNARKVAFSQSGTYMAVAHFTTPYVTIYKRSGDTFTKLADPSVLPAASGYSVVFSPDDSKLIVGHTNGSFITIYSRSGDVFTKISDPGSLPASVATSSAFRQDGKYLALSFQASPYFMVYKVAGDVFTKISDPTTLPPGSVETISYSRDGSILAVAHVGSPYISFYRQTDDVLDKILNPTTLPTGNGLCVAFSTSNIAVTYTATPYITIYDFKLKAYKSTNAIADVRQVASLGYALSAGVANDSKDAILIWR